MKRSTPLRRTGFHSSKRKAVPADRCPSCKLGVLGRVAVLELDWELAPGEAYHVVTGPATRCSACGKVELGPRGKARAFQDARRQQRMVIFERDGWVCQRCGRGGPGSGLGLEAAHKRGGLSLARNPGATAYSKENQEACCPACHGREHGQRRG